MRALVAWTQLFGSVSFELFGHHVGRRNAGPLFDEAVMDVGAFVGIFMSKGIGDGRRPSPLSGLITFISTMASDRLRWLEIGYRSGP
jgi:hypothetical protein